MEINVKELKRVTVVAPAGRIDHQTASELQRMLDDLIKKGQYRIVLDLSQATYISSAGLRVMLAERKAVRRFNRGDIYLANVSPQIRETLELVGLDRIFRIYDNLLDAVGNF